MTRLARIKLDRFSRGALVGFGIGLLAIAAAAVLHLYLPPRSAGLTGLVSSAGEPRMEGVLVTASRRGSPISVTVVSQADGRYHFPLGQLRPGHYILGVRAIGYELESSPAVTITAGEIANMDLHLRPVADLSAQMTNADWLLSIPGTLRQKKFLLDCMSCHTLERIVRSHYDADQFTQIIQRMAGFANNSIPVHYQRRVAQPSGSPEQYRAIAEYLSTINLSSGSRWKFRLRAMPRPSGRATRVVVTTYGLPRPTIAPHDVHLDAKGRIWYSDFDEQFIGRLDPGTGAVTEYPVPLLKAGFPTGSLDMEPDQAGDFWLALMFQGGIGRFDVRTKKFQLWPIPRPWNNDATQQSMVMPWQAKVDGKVWTNDVARHAIVRLDLRSGRFELFDPFKGMAEKASHSPYGLLADSHNNLFFLDFGSEEIGRIDAETGKATLYPTPTPGSRPRRGMIDSQGRIWFAEYGANRMGMFDTRTGRYVEWDVPTPWFSPYDVAVDKNGELWSGGMATDRILRLNPDSGEYVEYLLPSQTNIRKILLDNSTTPVTFWAGNNHGAAIIRLQPLK